MGGSGKQEKQWFPLPFLLSCESLVSVKENTNKKEKKSKNKEKKKIRIQHKPTERSSR